MRLWVSSDSRVVSSLQNWLRISIHSTLGIRDRNRSTLRQHNTGKRYDWYKRHSMLYTSYLLLAHTWFVVHGSWFVSFLGRIHQEVGRKPNGPTLSLFPRNLLIFAPTTLPRGRWCHCASKPMIAGLPKYCYPRCYDGL